MALAGKCNLTSLTGKLRTAPTLRNIISSLGEAKQGFDVRPIKADLPDGQKAGCIPFTLNKNGKDFFSELLRIDGAASKAHLLTIRSKHAAGENSGAAAAHLPYGLMFKGYDGPQYMGNRGTEWIYFFDWSTVLLGGEEDLRFSRAVIEAGKSSRLQLFPRSESMMLDTCLTAAHTKRHRYDDASFDERFDLLTVYNNDNIFPHTNSFSEDFQEVLWRNAHRFPGKKVAILGPGTGADTVYARRFGASSIWASDISLAYVLLSRWNFQFAQDTGQIDAMTSGSVNIHHNHDLKQAPQADIYLFNTPAIRSCDTFDQDISSRGELDGRSMFIPEEEFMPLFGELTKRLKKDGSSAIWRIIPSFEQWETSEHFPEPKKETVKSFGKVRGLFAKMIFKEGVIARARAKEFVERQTEVKGTVDEHYSDIFVFEG
ncbi:hypothetical protein ACFLZ2_04325 [Candidatus Margulisiibacteriota bacterium]